MTVRVTALCGSGISIEEYLKRRRQRELAKEREQREREQRERELQERERDVTQYYQPSPGQDVEVDEEGRWWGAQAAAFGLTGQLEGDAFRRLLDGEHPTEAQHLGRCHGQRSVRAYDVTFNAPKSVSLLYAFGEDHVRAQVHAAHDAAVERVLEFIESHAQTRVSVDGTVCVVDAQGIAVALFRQHTSRTDDPHLHTHAIVIAKVRDPRGGWKALDARMIKHDQRTLSALYHSSLRAELTRRLGVGWKTPVDGIAELDGIDRHVLTRFSKRTGQASDRLQVKLDRFRATLGREPNIRERWKLSREAARESRPAKNRTHTLPELTGRWTRDLADLGLTPDQLVANSIGRVLEPGGITVTQAARMINDAVSELENTVSTWRPNDLLRELARRVPTTTSVTADELVSWLERTTARELRRHLQLAPDPAALTPCRADGRPITESTLDHRLTTRTIWDQESAIHTWAEQRAGQPGVPGRIDLVGLDRAQQTAARAVAGTHPLVVIVGPAGAGKTTMLSAAHHSLTRDGRTVFGLAPSATAAGVLTAETGIPADTIDKLLHEHARLSGPSDRYRLPVGATVIVDEAGMLATQKLAHLAQLADHYDWRVVLVGDVRQLPAVGRGGMFGHLTGIVDPIELDGIHRFNEPWERDASLRLRAGDPRVLDVYEHHDRVHAAPREEILDEVLDAWRRHHIAGQSVVMLAPSNHTVDELNHAAQRVRLRAGELDRRRAVPGRGDVRLCVGDWVVTRENSRELRTDRGVMIRNRAAWTITTITHAGVTVEGRDGRVTLPHDYTRRAVELGYAQTIHGAQGRTIDHALLLADGPLDGRGLYVAMTRGRHSNHVYLTPEPGQDPRDLLERALAADWADRPALDTHTDLHHPRPEVRHVDPRLGRLQPLGDRELAAVWRERQKLAQLGIDRHEKALRNAERQLSVEQQRVRYLQQTLERVHRDLTHATGQRADMPRLGHSRQRATLDQRIQELQQELSRTRVDLDRSLAALPKQEAEVAYQHHWLREHADVPGRITELDRLLRLDAHARAQEALERDPSALDRLGPSCTLTDLGLRVQALMIGDTTARAPSHTSDRPMGRQIQDPDLGISF